MSTTKTNAGPKMVTIRIPKTKERKDDVFVSVNFRTYQIQRGVEVEVPYFVKKHIDEISAQDEATATMIGKLTDEWNDKARALR